MAKESWKTREATAKSQKNASTKNTSQSSQKSGSSRADYNRNFFNSEMEKYQTYDRDTFRAASLLEFQQKQADRRGRDLYDDFNQQASAFDRAVARDLSDENYFNAAQYFEERQKQADSLKKRASIVSQYLDDHMDSYTQESYDSMMEYLSTFDANVDEALSYYQPSVDARAGMRAYEDEMLAAMERNKQLSRLDRMADYAFDPGSPSANFMQQFRQYQNDESYRAVTDSWTDEERFNLGLLQQEDPAKAAEYATQINNYYNAKKTEDQRNQLREQAPGNIWSNTGKALIAGMAGAGEIIDRAAEHAARGQTTEKGYLTATDYSQETVRGISEHLNEKHGTVDTSKFQEMRDIGQQGLQRAGLDPSYTGGAGSGLLDLARDMVDGKGVGDLYNMGYSLAQNIANRYTLGVVGGQPLVLASYFANSATSAIDNARRNGATGDQAMGIGLISGALEVATEFLPVSELFNMGPAVTFKDFLKAVGIESLEEFVGEGANALGGYLADKFIMGDLSEFETTKRKYMEEQGLTEQEAHAMAIKDAVSNILFEGISGALSGAISGGTESAVRTGSANLLYRSVSPQPLIKAGLTTNADSESYLLAQQMQEKADNNQRISGSEKRVLAYKTELQQQAEAQAAVENSAADELAAMGETGDLKELARILVKYRNGEKLTKGERHTARGNENIQKLFDAADGSDNAATVSAEPKKPIEKPRVSMDGRSVQISSATPIDTMDFAEIKDGKATIQLKDGGTVDYTDVSFASEAEANQFYTVSTLPGIETEAANDLLHTIQEAGAGTDDNSIVGIREAYRMGYMGAPARMLNASDASVLPSDLQKKVYDIGWQQRRADTMARPAVTKANTVKPSGNYKKVVIEGKAKSISKKHANEIAIVDYIADKFSGTAVHVYESYTRGGRYYYRDSNGVEHTAHNGKYVNGEIWLDLNSGTEEGGMMLNTFAHEMYHHIEQFDKAKAQELAEFVVRELGMESVDKAVDAQIKKARSAGFGEEYFTGKGMTKEQAANEVYMRAMSDFVADSLEAVFTRGNAADAIARLHSENRTLFDEIKSFIDKWVNTIKEFYSDKTISQEGAMVAQLENFEQLQQLFMEAMQSAGENYRSQTRTTKPAAKKASANVQTTVQTTKATTADTQPQAVASAVSSGETEHNPSGTDAANIDTKTDPYSDDRATAPKLLRDFYDERPLDIKRKDIRKIARDPISVEWLRERGLEVTEDGLFDFLVEDYNIPGTEKNKADSGPKGSAAATEEDYFDDFWGEKPVASKELKTDAAKKAFDFDDDLEFFSLKDENSINPGEAGAVFNEDGDPVAMSTDDGSVMLSIRTYEEDGRKAFRDYLAKCVSSNRLTKAEMKEMINGIEEVYQICKDFKDKYAPFSAWSDAEVIRDTRGRPVFSVVTPNGDYKMNLDFSLVCKKRRTLDAVFNEMSRRGIIDDFELGQKSVVKINEIIRKYGLETACALCFVDAKRFRQASMADQFTRLYNELVESLVPEDQKSSIDHFNFSGYETIKKVDGGIDTWDNSKLDFSHLDDVMKRYGKGTVEHKAAKYIKNNPKGRRLLLRGDFMSSQGFDAVKTQNKDILKLYNSKKGTGGPKAAFGDVQYLNEIIKKARTWTPAKAYAVGGVRIQSFSDYVPRMVFDYVQMIYDLAATKLPAHAYTKEALFVKQFGLTGVKINMSLIPAIAEGGIAPGLDANGNYVWAGESFDYDTAVEIQNAEGYTENCGTICVGVSKQHIEKLLRDPNIRMVIPYHKSGLNPIVAHMNKIAEFTDYTNDQRTKGKDGKAVSKDFDFSKAMHDMGPEASPKAVADQYLKWCVANGYTAKFAEFATEENYYKLLEDFTLYDKDGNYVPQREVRAVFPTEASAFGSMKSLIQEGLQEDAVVEGKRDKNLSAIVDEIQRTLPKTEAEIGEEQVAQADRDLEAQYSIRNTSKMTLQEQLSAYYKGKFRLSDSFYFGETPNILARSGLDTLPIAFGQDDFKKSTVGKHNIPRRVLKNLNSNLKKPIFSFTHGKQAVIAIDDIDGDGKPVVVAIHGGHNMDRKPVNLMKSIYGLNNPKEWIGQQIDGGGKFRIYDKEKATAFLQTHGYLAEVGETSDGSWDIISKIDPSVNNEMNSLRNVKPATTRDILSAVDLNSRNKAEQHHLGQYQDRIRQLADLEPRLAEVNAQIEELSADERGNLKAIAQLQSESRNLNTQINGLNRAIRSAERSDMMKRIVAEERQKIQKQESKETLKDYKTQQKELLKSMQAEQRAIREELTGKESDVTLMEKEFIRLVKKYEQLDDRTGKRSIKDAKTIAQLKADLKAEAKSHKDDSKIWEREFNRLLTDYETSGRQIARLEATIARQRATAKARVEGRRKTEMRHKIQRKADELNNLLTHGTKHRNIPESLQPAVADILDAINMEVRDSDQRRKTYEATIARYDRQIEKASDPLVIEALIEKRDNYAAKGDQFANKMSKLQEAYKQIQEGKIPNMEIDEGLASQLDILFEKVGDTPLGQMTMSQLEAVNDVLNVTKATITNANKLFQEGQRQGIEEISKTAMREVRSVGGGPKKTVGVVEGVQKFGWNNMKPVYVFETIGSKVMTALFNNLRKGEDTLAVDLQESKQFFQNQWKKHKGEKWDMEKKWKFTSTSGKRFELDLNQMMSLYALSKRDQARDHLRVGGFSFDSQDKTKDEVKIGPIKFKADVKTTDASTYNLSDEILGEIISKLTSDQRAFVDEMQAYLSDTMAAKGNEISLQKYGIRLFKEQNYFPLRVADQFMAKVREQQTGDRKLKNAGFTKETTPNAKNPVVLSSFTEVWAAHVDEMSLYHSFVLPLDDISRVLNYHDQFVEGETAGSVVEAIRSAYGEGATQYIDQLIRDINGGARTDSVASTINNMMSKAKKAQTMASLSVAIQQPSAILRACSMVDGKYFLGRKVTEKMHDTTWEEIKKYAPIAIIKEMGGFDTNVGKSTTDYLTDSTDYDGFGEKFKAFFTDGDFRDDALGRVPALMDEMAWGAIWNAVKREQTDLHPAMNVKSDAFMKLVADRFTDVIVHTQVYDSVFSRSGLMRSKDTGVKMTTAFMAEPTTTINMLQNAVLQAKRGDISKVDAAKTVGAIVASLALNAALVSVAYAIRDDDEDKRYDEKWTENFWNTFFESLNPVGYIPILRDLQSMMQGFDVERADMALFGDLMNAIQGLTDEKRTAWEKTEAVIGSVGNLLGVPLKNIIRDGKGVFKTAAIALDKENRDSKTKTGKYIARRGLNLSDGEELLLAIQRGDEAHIQRVGGRFESQKKAESALQSAIRAKYIEGDLTAEEAEELLTTNFDREDEDEVYWLLEQWDYAKENGSTDGYAKYGTLYEAIESGNYEAEIDRLVDHGTEINTIRSQISKSYRNLYLTDENLREEIREKLQPVYEATGMYEDEILSKFNDWDFEAEYGMTYSAFKSEYKDGNITESEMRKAMQFYGYLKYEVEEKIRDLEKDIAFEKKFGMSLSELKDAYDNGDATRNQLINALVFTGKTRTDAQEEVSQRDISNRLGIDYAKLDDAYKYGDISRQTLYNAMIENGASREEADEAIVGYDWLKKNVKKYPGLTISDAKKFTIRISDKQKEYTLEDYGVSIDSYIEYTKRRPECKGVDANGDGQIDSGTLRDEIFQMIDSLPISNEAKDGLAQISYGIKSVRKNAPWH